MISIGRIIHFNFIYGQSFKISVAISVSVVDTEILKDCPGIVNKESKVILWNRQINNKILEIFDIFSKLDFNDQLEGIRELSKYILSKKRRKRKRKVKKILKK